MSKGKRDYPQYISVSNAGIPINFPPVAVPSTGSSFIPTPTTGTVRADILSKDFIFERGNAPVSPSYLSSYLTYVGDATHIFLLTLNFTASALPSSNPPITLGLEIYRGHDKQFPNNPYANIQASATISPGSTESSGSAGLIQLAPGDTVTVFVQLQSSSTISANALTFNAFSVSLTQVD